jgi:putative ABC transport system permease protein
MAVSSLMGNKMRSFLASLGIVVGISIVILIGWAINGLDASFQKTFEIMGVDILFVDKWDWAGRVDWREAQKRKNITFDDYELLKERLEVAELVLPEISQWGGKIAYDGSTMDGVSIVGVNPDNAKTPAGNLLKGRYFSHLENNANANVVIIGHKIYETLFPQGNAVGKDIEINKRKFNIIGVVQKRGTVIFEMIDNQVFVPINTFKKTLGTYGRSYRIAVKTGSPDNVDFVREETRGIFRSIRQQQPGEDDSFSINETKAFESTIADIKRWVYVIGISMTGLSFVVGIIGIMNIMFVSVTERTKEIGIRKSLGAKKSSILVQFIIESMLLCLFGSLISITICIGLVNLISFVLDKLAPANETVANITEFVLPTLPNEIVVIAVVVSAVVGILAGLIPASRAANLDPVEALRSD